MFLTLEKLLSIKTNTTYKNIDLITQSLGGYYLCEFLIFLKEKSNNLHLEDSILWFLKNRIFGPAIIKYID